MYLSTKYDPKYKSQKAHNELGLKVLSSPSHVTWNRVAERAVAEAHGEPGQHDVSNGDNVLFYGRKKRHLGAYYRIKF